MDFEVLKGPEDATQRHFDAVNLSGIRLQEENSTSSTMVETTKYRISDADVEVGKKDDGSLSSNVGGWTVRRLFLGIRCDTVLRFVSERSAPSPPQPDVWKLHQPRPCSETFR